MYCRLPPSPVTAPSPNRTKPSEERTPQYFVTIQCTQRFGKFPARCINVCKSKRCGGIAGSKVSSNRNYKICMNSPSYHIPRLLYGTPLAVINNYTGLDHAKTVDKALEKIRLSNNKQMTSFRYYRHGVDDVLLRCEG